MRPRSTQPARRPRPAALPALLLALVLPLAGGCATPIGVERADPQAVHRELTGNVLSTGELSDFTANVLRRAALDELAGRDPAAALAELHATGAAEAWARPEELFALAELSFRHAEDTGQPAHHLAAAVYAFAYLFPDGPGEAAPSPFDPRFRWAADLYNRGLTRAFDSAADGAAFEPRGGTFALPFGTLEVAFDPADLLWDGRRLGSFVPVADLQVRGLNNRYRWPGLGAPLAAGTESLRPEQGFQVGPRVKVPVTALLLLDQPRRQLSAGRLRGSLRLVAATDDEPVSIAGRTVPIEVEPTAALAYTLSDPAAWQTELRGFLRGDLLGDRPTNLGAMQPHRPGRFPVVFVHGTASSVGRWA
ncbi:MAG TPA: hypothetical protein VFG47_03985, partial [Geminicoccaceae bacterium]|nr:hypothetical protein [Geminicoccaceae bacterium]